jgi:hypothetical protein
MQQKAAEGGASSGEVASRKVIAESDGLATIPVIETGPAFPMETLEREEKRAHLLLDAATRIVPQRALKGLDRISRRWLMKWNNAHLSEIDEIARKLGRPGAYFLSVNYEWGCTCRVAPAPDGSAARLIRVLDWRTPGLGRNLLAARVAGQAGPFVTFTWPGYTGVLQGMAKGRFAAALNQAPMRRVAGSYALDWAANRRRVWAMPHQTPAHLLRAAFERANGFAEARRMLIHEPISTPAIYSIAGVKPSETAVIERTETEARVHDGANVAANHWQAPLWNGRARGNDSAGRACRMAQIPADLDATFPWLAPPILNARTRLVMVADARLGRVVVRGYEETGAATEPLDLHG